MKDEVREIPLGHAICPVSWAKMRIATRGETLHVVAGFVDREQTESID
jgi:hypothetical protein